jgi:hypothetical protein
MKYYLVILKSGKEIIIKAQSYHKDANHYVFDGTIGEEVQFVLTELVASITVLRDKIDPPGSGVISIPL